MWIAPRSVPSVNLTKAHLTMTIAIVTSECSDVHTKGKVIQGNDFIIISVLAEVQRLTFQSRV